MKRWETGEAHFRCVCDSSQTGLTKRGEDHPTDRDPRWNTRAEWVGEPIQGRSSTSSAPWQKLVCSMLPSSACPDGLNLPQEPESILPSFKLSCQVFHHRLQTIAYTTLKALQSPWPVVNNSADSLIKTVIFAT